MAHRIIWKMITGEEPECIDHINGFPSDNRWRNLRAATYSLNRANSVSKHRIGLPRGVVLHRKTGRYQAQIETNGKKHYLGLFDQPDEAHEAYVQAAKERFGEFAMLSHAREAS